MASKTARVWDYFTSLTDDGTGVRHLKESLSEIEKRFSLSPGALNTIMRRWRDDGKLEIIKGGSAGKTSPVVAVRLLNGVDKKTATPERRTPEHEPAPVTGAMRERLLNYLKSHSNERGNFKGTSDKARRDLGISRHDFNKLLFDLKEQGLIAFAAVGSGSNMRLTTIRIRPSGLVKQPLPDPTVWPSAPKGSWVSDEGWLVVESDQAFTHNDWYGSQGKIYRGQHGLEEFLKPESDEEPTVVQELIAESTPEESDQSGYWPLIEELVKKAASVEKVKAAALALDEAGLEGLAIQALEAGGALSPLETEIVAYWEHTHRES